jgi:uncharacterized membrane protein
MSWYTKILFSNVEQYLMELFEKTFRLPRQRMNFASSLNCGGCIADTAISAHLATLATVELALANAPTR